MNIQGLSQVGQLTKLNDSGDKVGNESGFSKIYHAALDLMEETNTLQKNAEQSSLDFALGKTDNAHDVMIAQEKATIALQYTIQIRDKALTAYNEIMRIQV